MDRRQFIASSLGVGLATAVGATFGKDTLSGIETAFAEEGQSEAISILSHNNLPIDIAESYKRFDQKNTGFSRGIWDTKMQPHLKTFVENEMGIHGWKNDEPGWTHLDHALSEASWGMNEYAANLSQMGLGNVGVYSWNDFHIHHEKYQFKSPEEASSIVKKGARVLEADLVGIADYDERWTYASFFDPRTGEAYNADFPFKVKHVVAIAVEMDYDILKTSPSVIAGAAVGLGYSKMAEVSHKVAQFIRKLGYNAIACGNDTALSVPIAIQAGLGEMGRNGLLITPKYGPRVRLCKVLTDMPLKADKPITFGVEKFCKTCKKCAIDCPSESIPLDDEPTMNGPNASCNDGVKKWYVNAETCLEFWAKNGNDCKNCIASCPYNKLPVWNHKFALEMTKTPVRSLLPPMDDLFGYGKTYNTKAIKKFWKE